MNMVSWAYLQSLIGTPPPQHTHRHVTDTHTGYIITVRNYFAISDYIPTHTLCKCPPWPGCTLFLKNQHLTISVLQVTSPRWCGVLAVSWGWGRPRPGTVSGWPWPTTSQPVTTSGSTMRTCPLQGLNPWRPLPRPRPPPPGQRSPQDRPRPSQAVVSSIGTGPLLHYV